MIESTRLVLKEVEESSAILSAGYDSVSHTLAIRFRDSSGVYLYLNVPPKIAYSFLHEKESKGTYLNNVIRPYYFSVQLS